MNAGVLQCRQGLLAVTIQVWWPSVAKMSGGAPTDGNRNEITLFFSFFIDLVFEGTGLRE